MTPEAQPMTPNFETETIDRLFLELSQFTKARTRKELVAKAALELILKEPTEDCQPSEMRLRLIAKEALAELEK
jgi:hypothetical protein